MELDEITKKLLAAKMGVVWGPHPLIRRVKNKKGEERLQQLWISNAQNMDWRDIPLFSIDFNTNQETYVDEGDSAINTGPLLGGAAAQGGDVPKV